jgi:hypothetical protein
MITVDILMVFFNPGFNIMSYLSDLHCPTLAMDVIHAKRFQSKATLDGMKEAEKCPWWDA